MENKIFKALILTFVLQAGIYQFAENSSDWNISWTILPIFCACFIGVGLFSGQQKPQKRSKRNVIDLDQYRRKRRLKKKKDRLRKERRTARENRIVIFKSCNTMEIERVQSILKAHHISFNLKNVHSASLLPSIEGVEIEVQVLKRDLERASKLLTENNVKPLDHTP